MTGIQYVLWSAQPPLYVICKHRRNNMQNVTPLAYYYVINGTVYQAPDVYTFVQSRLLGAVEPLKNAFDQVIQYSRYNVAKGYYWQFDKKPATKKDDEKDPPGNSEPMDTDVKPEMNEEPPQSQQPDGNPANPGTSVAKSK
ncbi:MED6 mediator sub complex component [Ancylostoma ceylanicum]|uniref:Mediator of RNA polymerase II transcription subunit 6 n=1 Tax=Ancylostoma ceylanicum TaxID=53326 RepID=A0A0D6LJM0_9BILA|nr:MED6 mediator sub complex component [Ancylostoma ceylanicum]